MSRSWAGKSGSKTPTWMFAPESAIALICFKTTLSGVPVKLTNHFLGLIELLLAPNRQLQFVVLPPILFRNVALFWCPSFLLVQR